MDRRALRSVYKPYAKNLPLLNYAMQKIKSVPYRVSARWVFYQLVQAGYITKKGIDKFDALLSRVRKNFWNGWSPDTLTDTIRNCDWKGEGYYFFNLKLDSIVEQEWYMQVWFEAQAMYEQFAHYTKDYRVSLIPFRGDCSIPIKWQLAKKLEEISEKYNKSIIVLYYGDYDKKGLQISEAALKDIREWCSVDFRFERIGLTLEQAKEFGVPENPLRPNAFQWEALSDEQAKSLILKGVAKYIEKISPSLQSREKDLLKKATSAIQEVLKDEGIISTERILKESENK